MVAVPHEGFIGGLYPRRFAAVIRPLSDAWAVPFQHGSGDSIR